MSLQRILDDLQSGGETAKLMYLASCGSEIGVGEDGQPDLYVKVLAVTAEDDNLVTLRVAAGQEAADAGIANMEVTVASPEEATKLMEVPLSNWRHWFTPLPLVFPASGSFLFYSLGVGLAAAATWVLIEAVELNLATQGVAVNARPARGRRGSGCRCGCPGPS
jgi:hypothetical protein